MITIYLLYYLMGVSMSLVICNLVYISNEQVDKYVFVWALGSYPFALFMLILIIFNKHVRFPEKIMWGTLVVLLLAISPTIPFFLVMLAVVLFAIWYGFRLTRQEKLNEL